MKKLGELLKSEREKKRLSVHEIGIYLKISPKILTSIEDGDLTKLPAKTFLRGFIRSYAQYLKLNTEEIMAMFQEEMGSTHPPAKELPKELAKEVPSPKESTKDSTMDSKMDFTKEASNPTSKETKTEPKRRDPDLNEESFSSNKIIFSLAALVLVALIVTVAKLIEKYNKEREANPIAELQRISPLPPSSEDPNSTEAKIPVISPQNIPAEPLQPLQNKIETNLPQNSQNVQVLAENGIEKTLEKSTEVAIQKNIEKTSEKFIDKKTDVLAKKAAEKPSGKLPEKPIEKPSEKTSETAVDKPNEKLMTEKTQTPKPSAKLEKPIEVIIEATKDVSLNYDLGNGKLLPLNLEKGQFHTFKSKSEIRLDVNDAGAINVFVNGTNRGAAGIAGSSKSLNYP